MAAGHDNFPGFYSSSWSLCLVMNRPAGTGYMAACLSQLVRPSGSVLALEKQPKLVERARHSILASLTPDLSSIVDVRVCNVMAGGQVFPLPVDLPSSLTAGHRAQWAELLTTGCLL